METHRVKPRYIIFILTETGRTNTNLKFFFRKIVLSYVIHQSVPYCVILLLQVGIAFPGRWYSEVLHLAYLCTYLPCDTLYVERQVV